MREPMVSQETWSYECLNCLNEWRKDFEVWRCPDGHGGDVVVYLRNGHRCVSPWADLVCPVCRSYNVKILPVGGTEPVPVSPQRRGELGMVFHLRKLHAY